MGVETVEGNGQFWGKCGASHCDQLDSLSEGRRPGSSQITLGFLVLFLGFILAGNYGSNGKMFACTTQPATVKLVEQPVVPFITSVRPSCLDRKSNPRSLVDISRRTRRVASHQRLI